MSHCGFVTKRNYHFQLGRSVRYPSGKPNQDAGVARRISIPESEANIFALTQNITALLDSLHDSFKTDSRYDHSGSTFSGCVVLPDGQYVAAYIGDSPLYMATCDAAGIWSVEMLNAGRMHLPDPSTYNPFKKSAYEFAVAPEVPRRFLESVGMNGCCRLLDNAGMPSLMMSRSLGDYATSSFAGGHSHAPTFITGQITPGQKAFIFAATDGLSDVVTLPELVRIFNSSDVLKYIDAGRYDLIAEAIANYADSAWPLHFQCGPSDDVTVALACCMPSAPMSAEADFVLVQMVLAFDGHGQYGHVFSQHCLREFQERFPKMVSLRPAIASSASFWSDSSSGSGGGSSSFASSAPPLPVAVRHAVGVGKKSDVTQPLLGSSSALTFGTGATSVNSVAKADLPPKGCLSSCVIM